MLSRLCTFRLVSSSGHKEIFKYVNIVIKHCVLLLNHIVYVYSSEGEEDGSGVYGGDGGDPTDKERLARYIDSPQIYNTQKDTVPLTVVL